MSNFRGFGRRQHLRTQARYIQMIIRNASHANVPAPRILVVESEAFIRALMVDALQDAGFEVDHTGVSDTAVRFLDADGYQALVTDVHLVGRLSGVELAARAGAAEPNLPVVIITTQLDPIAKLRAAGVNVKAIAKPFDTMALVAILRRVLAATADADD
jgi:DNA-binding response OmpR family regulator